jgi:hypothetical protein
MIIVYVVVHVHDHDHVHVIWTWEAAGWHTDSLTFGREGIDGS